MDDKIFFAGEESLEHTDETRREGEQRHIVSFILKKLCSLILGL